MNNYKIYTSAHNYISVYARSKSEAKRIAWNEIKDGYTYGWTKDDFLRNVTVVEA